MTLEYLSFQEFYLGNLNVISKPSDFFFLLYMPLPSCISHKLSKCSEVKISWLMSGQIELIEAQTG